MEVTVIYLLHTATLAHTLCVFDRRVSNQRVASKHVYCLQPVQPSRMLGLSFIVLLRPDAKNSCSPIHVCPCVQNTRSQPDTK